MTDTIHRRPRPAGAASHQLTPEKTSARPARPRPLPDEDDRPRRPRAVGDDHAVDDRPRRPRPRRYEDEEEPQPRRLKKRSRSFPWVGVLVGGGGVVGLVMVLVVGTAIWYTARIRSKIDPAEWKEVAPAQVGFQALMPGTPRQDHQTQQTPAGNIELDKFIVEPKGKNELFMVMSMRFPDAVGRALGGPQKLLELGRKDVLAASQGQLKSEKQITLNDWPGLEMEVLPATGGILKSRVYATNNQLYTVTVGVSQVRLSSEDVQTFFESFKLPIQPVAAVKPRAA
jgi:hypothetical protein